MEQEYYQESEINLGSLFKLIVRKCYLIVLCFIFGTSVAAMYSYLRMDDVYTAKSSMIVQVDSETQNESTNLATGTRLVDTYRVFITSNKVLTELKENLELTYTLDEIKDMIKVSSVNNTIIIDLQVTSNIAEETSAIANELVSIVHNQVITYDGLEDIEVVDVALTPTDPSGPNRPLYIVMGAFIGVVIGVGGIFLVEILDRKIKNDKDVETKLNLKVLGVIPDYAIPEGGNNNG